MRGRTVSIRHGAYALFEVSPVDSKGVLAMKRGHGELRSLLAIENLVVVDSIITVVPSYELLLAPVVSLGVIVNGFGPMIHATSRA